MRSKNRSELAKTWFRSRLVQRPDQDRKRPQTEKDRKRLQSRSFSVLVWSFWFQKMSGPVSVSVFFFFGPKNRTGPDFRALATVGTLITHTPWRTVQAMHFKGLWVAGGGKKTSTHEGHGNLRNICIFCYNKSTQLEGKQSMSSGQVIIDAFLFSSVFFMNEQRLICGGGALWADSRAFGD